MENSLGFMAIFAVSGSVLFLARQLHNRLLTEFMEKIESELRGSEKCHAIKKKVRFADDVVEPSSDNKKYRKRHMKMGMKTGGVGKGADDAKCRRKETMPPNRRALYKGILEYKGHMSCNYV